MRATRLSTCRGCGEELEPAAPENQGYEVPAETMNAVGFWSATLGYSTCKDELAEALRDLAGPMIRAELAQHGIVE